MKTTLMLLSLSVAGILLSGCAGNLPYKNDPNEWKKVTLVDITEKGYGSVIKLGDKRYLFQMWKNDRAFEQYCKARNGIYDSLYVEDKIDNIAFANKQLNKLTYKELEYGEMKEYNIPQTRICTIDNKIEFFTFAKKSGHIMDKKSYYQILDYSNPCEEF